MPIRCHVGFRCYIPMCFPTAELDSHQAGGARTAIPILQEIKEASCLCKLSQSMALQEAERHHHQQGWQLRVHFSDRPCLHAKKSMISYTAVMQWPPLYECPPWKGLKSSCGHTGERLRCVGSALSPNGLAFTNDGLVSLQLMDKVLDINSATNQVCTRHGG